MRFHATSARAGNRDGFTLIELVVVLLVLSAMAAVTLPSFLEAPLEDDMTVATRRIESLFRLARDSSARSGRRVSVVIDSVTARVWFDVAGVVPATEDMVTRGASQSGMPPGEELELPRGVTLELTTSRATFAFAPSGAVFADSLLLVSSLGTRVIKLQPWTGDVLVY